MSKCGCGENRRFADNHLFDQTEIIYKLSLALRQLIDHLEKNTRGLKEPIYNHTCTRA